MKISIRTLTVADLDAADRITRAAYAIAATRKSTLKRYLQLQPDGWLLALLDNAPVGMGGATDYGSFAQIGMMGVLPSAQGRGVGHALMEQLLAWLAARECPTVLLDATDAGARLYQRFGFTDEDTTVEWQYATLPADVPRPLDGNIHHLKMQDIPALTAFDAPFFGAGRAAVFASLLLEYPNRAFVTRDRAGQLSGYLFAQSRVLGPWGASNREAAERLLKHALALPFSVPPVAITPTANTPASAMLHDAGFRQQRVLRHMRRGAPALLRKRTQLYGQASFALG